ncbi:hypothetical protein NL50_01010 [Clostridium acetobutylicum]|nr:hypothetical protein NL50_01010 [Clostridium acetobutylicum]
MDIRKNLKVLSHNRMFTGMGYYVTVPLLAVILTNIKGIDVGTTGIIVAGFGLAAKGGSLITFIFPRLLYRKKYIISFGTLLTSFGLFFSMFITNYYILGLLIIMSGLGISLNLLGIQTYISSNIRKEEGKLDNYTLQIWIANITAVIGPILGGYLIKSGMLIIFFISSIFYLLAFINTLIAFNEGVKTSDNIGNQNVGQILKKCFNNRSLWAFLILVFFMWFIYSQLYFSVSLYVSKYLGATKMVGYLMSLNAFILVVFQGLVNRIIRPRIKVIKNIFFAISIGFIFIGFGYILIMLGKQLFILVFIGVSLLSLGELIIMPLFDYVISRFGNNISTVYYFSIYTIICGIGYGGSTYLFGNIFNESFQLKFVLLAILSLIASILSIINWKLNEKKALNMA